MGGYEEGISVISGKQKIVPQKCMSCGVKCRGRQQLSMEIMGSDGKYYRADVKGTGVGFESPEVWDVMPSQMAFVPHTSIKRDRVSSSKAKEQGVVGTTIVPKSTSRPHSAFRT